MSARSRSGPGRCSLVSPVSGGAGRSGAVGLECGRPVRDGVGEYSLRVIDRVEPGVDPHPEEPLDSVVMEPRAPRRTRV
jgi:hypothetical protein